MGVLAALRGGGRVGAGQRRGACQTEQPVVPGHSGLRSCGSCGPPPRSTGAADPDMEVTRAILMGLAPGMKEPRSHPVRTHQVPLFAGLSAAALQALERLAVEREFAPGAVLWHAGNSPRALHVVLEGEVR